MSWPRRRGADDCGRAAKRGPDRWRGRGTKDQKGPCEGSWRAETLPGSLLALLRTSAFARAAGLRSAAGPSVPKRRPVQERVREEEGLTWRPTGARGHRTDRGGCCAGHLCPAVRLPARSPRVLSGDASRFFAQTASVRRDAQGANLSFPLETFAFRQQPASPSTSIAPIRATTVPSLLPVCVPRRCSTPCSQVSLSSFVATRPKPAQRKLLACDGDQGGCRIQRSYR